MIIALSGACHSGKSTFSLALKEIEPNRIILYDEIIRKETIKDLISDKSIDELRKNPDLYFKVQENIITQKISDELSVVRFIKARDKLIIFDRSLIDSLYYYILFLNKNHDESDLPYFEFLNFLIKKIKEHVSNIYDYIFILKPIKKFNTNFKYRPKLLEIIQDSEYEIIKALTFGFARYKTKELDYDKSPKDFLQELNCF